MLKYKCKICRMYGQKFLLNERCASPKCALSRRRTRPGQHGSKIRILSEYGKELVEKQKVKFYYLLRERQMKKYFKLAEKAKEPTPIALAKILEKRLDNIVFRAGFFNSKPQARQAVVHGHIFVNGKKLDRPSYLVEIGDVISPNPRSLKKGIFNGIYDRIKKYQPPSWIELNKEKLEAKIVGEPVIEELKLPFDYSLVVEFYGR
jgi:small subunit ribosomal protein S4